MKIIVRISFIYILFIVIGFSCSSEINSDDQLYITHVGESDQPIEDILIYVNNSIITKDVDSTFMLKFRVSKSDFNLIKTYVVAENTKKVECQQCNRGTLKINLFSPYNSVRYIVESEKIKSYSDGISKLVKSNKGLQKFIESNITEQL